MRSIYLDILTKILFLLVIPTSKSLGLDSAKSSSEIQVKLFKISENSLGTLTEIVFNVTENLVLRQDYKRVELVCRAKLPIKWEYIYEGKTLPLLEVEYKRILKNEALSLQELKNGSNSAFEGCLILRGLLESQTGKYVCRYYNGRLTNNSYDGSVSLNIFVPGNRTFNQVTHVKFVNKTDDSVIIPCPVTDPNQHVRLFKLNEDFYNKTGGLLKWKSIYTTYDPFQGFLLQGGLGRSLLGDYNCTADNGNSIRLLIADISTKAAYEAHLIRLKSCWETEDFVRLTRSKRLECFCKDSYGLFVNDVSLEEENRRGSCDSNYMWLSNLKENCSDWRLNEFFGNGEESQKICYRDEIRDMFNGTGTRIILRVTAKQTSNLSPWERNVTIFYDGIPSWASGFKLGLQKISNITGASGIDIVDQDPTMTQLYPLAHHTAIWKDLIIDIREVKKIHVFQPDSFSFEWFEVSKPIPSVENEIPNRNSTSISGSISLNTSTLPTGFTLFVVLMFALISVPLG